jgi:hypothetical protein
MSLRCFLFLMLLSGLSVAYIGKFWGKHFHELNVVKDLSNGRYSISVTESKPRFYGLIPSRVTGVSLFANKSISIDSFQSLLQFGKLESLNVSLTNVGPRHFSSGPENHAIRKIVAVLCHDFNDRCFTACCDRFRSLEFFDVTDTGVTESGGVSIAKLTRIKNLEVAGTKVGDKVVAEIARHCLGIEELNVAGTDISNKSIQLLMGLPAIRMLDVSKTSINVESLIFVTHSTSLEHLTYWSQHPIERSLCEDVKESLKSVEVTIGPTLRGNGTLKFNE